MSVQESDKLFTNSNKINEYFSGLIKLLSSKQDIVVETFTETAKAL